MADSARSLGGTRRRRRLHPRLLYRLETELEPVMFLLAIAWLALFLKELAFGLTEWQYRVGVAIWIGFILEFLLKLYLAPRRPAYLVQNWITVLALLVPALRAFRLLRALRLLRTVRVTSTTRIVRALASSRRFWRDLQEAQGQTPAPEMHVGLLVAASPATAAAELERFAAAIAAKARPELEHASGLTWHFHQIPSRRLEADDPRMPSDFLDAASFGMVRGPYDTVIVVTDVVLISHERQARPGLASPTARIAVISTRQFVDTAPESALDMEASRNNGAALLLHLIGHLSGLEHRPRSPVMRPFAIRAPRRVPSFTAAEREHLARARARLPERELHGGGSLASVVFHILMALRHPAQLLRPLWRNRAPLLPLSLPGLATAAVAPSFLLVFTAEIWDVGLGMSNGVAVFYAIASILAASLFLARVQSLFLPRKERNVLTEHLAVANSVIFLSILLACIGLFVIVGALMLAIELWIFPADLMQTWPTLDQPDIAFADKLRLSAFIATVGVTTGALAGGFESRTVIRNLALFENDS